MTQVTDTLADLAARHDAFLIDQFGVLMQGDGPYPFAARALAALAALRKPVLILSNSGKRAEPNCARLVQNGFDRAHFQTVLSSGELAHGHLTTAIGDSLPRGARVLVLIRDGDTPPLDGLDVTRTDDPDNADLLLIVSRDPARALGDYDPLLGRLARRGVPALCVNPDLKMLTPGGLRASAGRLAQMFEAQGGAVTWFGKPHPPIYRRALDMLGNPAPDRVLCIGDSPAHDIAGGRRAGLRTALVRTGIHADLDDAALADLIAAEDCRPDHILPAFDWDGPAT